ncbi:hypothetical protein H4Q26_017187 [Puccinia striiformis f. sp. tritici PST-130]|nr:hypothetical protein H4Q26_017187 [Puccinia striiformis f. sp. tritici PST-130]
MLRRYRARRLDSSLSISGMDDGLWVVPDGTRRRPWVMGEIKTTHPHSALADKYILGRVGSVSVTFSRANIVPLCCCSDSRLQWQCALARPLGFIENHPPGTELGLVADEVDEVIAHFTFYYRSKEMLQRLLPTGFSSETKISFPTEPRTQDERSIQSTEDLDGGRGQAKSGGFEGNRASVLRRAFGTNNSPRHSINGSLPTPLLGSEQDEFGKLGKFGGKRVRAVSLRLSKRLSSTGAKPDEKNPLSTPEVTSPDSPASNHEDLNTMQGLRNEVIQLRRLYRTIHSTKKEEDPSQDVSDGKIPIGGQEGRCSGHSFQSDVATMATDGSRQLVTEFKLESESALNAIPKAVLQNAHGLAIFTILKVGFVWSGKAGSGIVIARLDDGSWSAPSCIATGGVGFGLQVGADFSEFVIVLNSEEAVRAFATTGNMTIGGNLSAAVGPIGTGGAVNASLLHPAPLFTYSKNKGLFAGISLEGTALIERKDTNEAFYGQRIPSLDILRGKVPPPEAASALYDVIESAEQLDESSLPQESYVPGGAADDNPQRDWHPRKLVQRPTVTQTSSMPVTPIDNCIARH